MTDAFKAKFAELCKAEPKKFEMHELSGSTRRKYWVNDNFYMSTDDKSCLWFLHKLAEALGGVVWVHPFPSDDEIPEDERPRRIWLGYWNELVGEDKFIDQTDYEEYEKPELALESAVIGLVEWYLQNRRK